MWNKSCAKSDEICWDETRETGQIRREYSAFSFFSSRRKSLMKWNDSFRSVRLLERRISAYGALEDQCQATIRLMKINYLHWTFKINMEMLLIINGKARESNRIERIKRMFRFGDGYVLIGFSAGYLIAVSTYHKEIGNVRHDQSISSIEDRYSFRNCSKHVITKEVWQVLLYPRCWIGQQRLVVQVSKYMNLPINTMWIRW
jgi:hypothetical protein